MQFELNVHDSMVIEAQRLQPPEGARSFLGYVKMHPGCIQTGEENTVVVGEQALIAAVSVLTKMCQPSRLILT